MGENRRGITNGYLLCHTFDTLTLSILAMGVGCATPTLVPLPLAPTMG